jgi:DNA-binding transcriptional regulator YiaG
MMLPDERKRTLSAAQEKETFGDWLLRNRRAQRLSQPELQARTGVSKQYISNLERNTRQQIGNELIRPRLCLKTPSCPKTA